VGSTSIHLSYPHQQQQLTFNHHLPTMIKVRPTQAYYHSLPLSVVCSEHLHLQSWQSLLLSGAGGGGSNSNRPQSEQRITTATPKPNYWKISDA
jgi:hypothetical protein